VDLEGELMCALSGRKKIGKMNSKQKEKLQKYEEEDRDSKEKMSQILEETKKIIIILKVQLEEVIRIEEVVGVQLKEKKENYKKLEYEIVSLRKELKKKTIESKFKINSVETLGIHSLRLVLSMIRVK
jgi:hypothetical protein